MTTERVFDPTTTAKHYAVRYKVWDYRFRPMRRLKRFVLMTAISTLNWAMNAFYPSRSVGFRRCAMPAPRNGKSIKSATTARSFFGTHTRLPSMRFCALTDYLHVNPQAS